MTNVIAHIKPTLSIPKHIPGPTTYDKKTGTVSVETRLPRSSKTVTKRYTKTDIIGYKEGEAGFVLVMSSEPIASFVGVLTSDSEGNPALKTEDGNIRLNSNVAGVTYEYQETDADSKEARIASASVPVAKVRRAPAETAAPARKRERSAPAAAAPAGKTRSARKAAAEAAAAPVAKRRRPQ